MSEADSPVTKALKAMHQKLVQDAGDTAIDLWKLFEAMRPEDRKALKDWIDKVAPLAPGMTPCNLLASLEVSLRYPTGPEDDIRVDGVPVGAVRWVLDGFERGDKPAPPTLRDLGFSV